jgi:Uma2 family endonuclease
MEPMSVMPRQSHDWTVDDLELLPDDGLQYELLDGLLLVTPAPIPDHQRFARGIFRVLDAACPSGFEVFFAPLDWQPDRRTSLQPDVLVVAVEQIGPKKLTESLALAVEVLSPSTRRKDQVLKRSKYEDAGVACYWIVDPDGPSVTAWRLSGGRYVGAGAATGDQQLALADPFAVTLRPSDLPR